MTYMRPDNIFDINARPVWLFFDHRAGLDVNAMMQAAMIFALKDTYELATMIGCADEVKEYPALVKAMTKAARKAYYDKDKAGKDLVKELQNHVKQETAPYKYPRIIEFTDELPKTISGKIRRVDIRNKE